MELRIEAPGLGAVVAELGATEKQVEAALRSTLGKMAAWMRVLSIRGLSKQLQVSAKVMRRRLKAFKLRKTADGSSVAVWYGLDPIALIHLGARQTRAGVTAGKHKRPSAFIARGANESRQVFKRTGKPRLPIEKQTLSIQEKAEAWIEDALIGGPEFERKFMAFFEHELKWRTQIQKST